MGGIFITVGDLFACGMEIHPKTPPEVAAHINDFKSTVIQAESGNISVYSYRKSPLYSELRPDIYREEIWLSKPLGKNADIHSF